MQSSKQIAKDLMRPLVRRLRRAIRRLGRGALRLTHRPLAELYYRWIFPSRRGVAGWLADRVAAWEAVARPYETPAPRSDWERQYADGFWSFMETDPLQAGRYALAAGYLRFFTAPGVEILDIGCGEGVLLDYLRPEDRESYEGIDLSEAAVDAARDRYGSRGATFGQADASEFEPGHPVDVVVFNGVLLCIDDPLREARRYAEHLKPEGLMLVVTYRGSERARAILRRLDDEFTSLVRATCSAEGPLPTPGPVPYDWSCTVLTPVDAPPEELRKLFHPRKRRAASVTIATSATPDGRAARSRSGPG